MHDAYRGRAYCAVSEALSNGGNGNRSACAGQTHDYWLTIHSDNPTTVQAGKESASPHVTPVGSSLGSPLIRTGWAL